MNRRDFLHGLMTGAAALGTSAAAFPIRSWAQAGAPDRSMEPLALPRRLAIVHRTIEVSGKAARVFGLTQPDGTPGLTLDAGSSFDVALTNEIDEPTLIHWHGLTPPWAMDGVPDNPAALLRPSEVRRYSFPVGAGGTHWMHAHTLQEQNLLAAPMIVRTAEEMRLDEQEVVILLHDFSFTPAEELLASLKAGTSSTGGMLMDHGAMGHGEVMPAMGMQQTMQGGMPGASMPGGAMAGMDLNDIDYDAYLANDRTLDDPQVVTVEKSGRVRLRLINGATATAFTIDTGSLSGQLVAVDGRLVQPLGGRSFPISMGQRLDIRLTLPAAGGAHPILALREGGSERTGIILASAGARIGKVATVGEQKGPVVGLDLEPRLRAVAPLAERNAARRFALVLSGNMAGYSWGIGGADALAVKRGERIEMLLRNMSMMAHPMHLHGHHFQVVDINGTRLAGAVRDTVVVPPMAAVTIAFDADNPGRWPLHCHHLYHMATGMMAFVGYAS
ncbi:multicopper oxidase family protein [Ancylobacter polymorphus]|jgi:FtsP/CotA-like multicopper oxidase with cupredoxin domain|uniref:FtsP/CotA-like multicopper oxidase with cupredoxin domain n=1 Tax=Ancylobacter polymorphus TaxID=223390 RepID=A0ABU0BGD2_9HYPH|nr:multicopper oxidase domain-containing protein [Ancylobacter polymorphus]MDQ0304892.1 FtsP/CotA-like multicopper oxidase with cupredoxin domain [Ancylobacter polymorphus]